MIQRPSTQSFDDTSTVDDPQIDPAAAQWHNWAARTSKQTTTETSSSDSPTTASSLVTTLHNRPSNLLETLHSHHEQPEHRSSLDQEADLSQVDFNLKVQSLFSEPPLCFCQKLASQSESSEFGVIYECHFMTFDDNLASSPVPTRNIINSKGPNDTSNKTPTHICGFHVHWAIWKKMGDDMKRKQVLNYDDPELATCPYFNFTYCVAFRVFNELKKSSPLAPRCFCNRRVVLSDCEYNQKRRICFVCPNFYVDGAKPKCSWFLWAEELAFNRPKYPRHSPLLIDEAKSRIRSTSQGTSLIPNTSNSTSSSTSASASTSTSTSTSSSSSTSTTVTIDRSHQSDQQQLKPMDREQHTLGLLSTLTSANLSSLKISDHNSLAENDSNHDNNLDYNDATKNDDTDMKADDTKNDKDTVEQAITPSVATATAEQEDHYFDAVDKQMTENHQNLDQLVYGSEDIYLIGPTQKDLSTTSNRFIPPSVMRNSPHKSLLSHHEQHHHHTPYDTDDRNTRKNIQAFWDIMHQQATMIHALQEQGLEHNQQMKHVLKKQHFMEQEIDYLRDVMEKEKKQLQNSMNAEIALRQKNQQQLACMEESLENLLEENTALAMEAKRTSSAPKEPPKCQVCYSADVECAVVPCFHSVYCLDCAQKLKECAICRMPKFSVQKVYLC